MDSDHFEICASRSATGMARSLRWSKVSPPRQPVRSLPLKKAVKPGGGFGMSAAAPKRRQALRSTSKNRNGLRGKLRVEFMFMLLLKFSDLIKLFRGR